MERKERKELIREREKNTDSENRDVQETETGSEEGDNPERWGRDRPPKLWKEKDSRIGGS